MSSANGHAHQRKILTPDEIAALPEEHLPFKLEDHSVDESRPFRVVVIGAGLSGIYGT